MQTARYSISERTHEEPMAPARFSVKLGQSADTTVDVPFCLSVPPKAQINYSGYGSTQDHCLPGPLYAKSSPVGNFPAFTDDVRDLTIVDVLGASTAVPGGAHMFEPVVGIADMLDLRLAMWTSLARHGKAFAKGRECVEELHGSNHVTQESLRRLADAGVIGLADAGYVDNVGAGHALVAGSKEIVIFLYNQHCGATTPHGDFAAYFQGGPQSLHVGKLPIFARSRLFDMSYDDMCEQYSKFPQIHAPENAKFLHSISLGTFKKLTTVEAPLWGLPQGMEVTLHIVTLNMRGPGLHEFGLLAQDIVSTILSPANEELVNSVLLGQILIPQPA